MSRARFDADAVAGPTGESGMGEMYRPQLQGHVELLLDVAPLPNLLVQFDDGDADIGRGLEGQGSAQQLVVGLGRVLLLLLRLYPCLRRAAAKAVVEVGA